MSPSGHSTFRASLLKFFASTESNRNGLTIRFEGETGMAQYDPVARKVYVNLQDENLFAITPKERQTRPAPRIATSPILICWGAGYSYISAMGE